MTAQPGFNAPAPTAPESLEPAPQGAGSPSSLASKCAYATRVAFQASEAAQRATWAVEAAFDELNAQQRRLDAARAAVAKAAHELAQYHRDLNLMNSAFIERFLASQKKGGA